MPPLLENPVLMFTALWSLYSPLASVSSYFPTLGRLRPAEQRRLALGLFAYVVIFSMIAIWVGEPLLKLLGLTTAALTVTGGIALFLVGIPLMRGTEDQPARRQREPEPGVEIETKAVSWRSVVFMPITFPLTVGGTTFAIMVSFRSQARNLLEVGALSIAALAYAAVTALTVYASGQLERRVSARTRILLQRLSGILLTAIAVSLLAKGGSRMVLDSLAHIRAQPTP